MTVTEARDRMHLTSDESTVTSSMVAAGIIEIACRVGESYGYPRAKLLAVGGLTPENIADPGARLPSYTLWRIVQHVVEQSGDRAFGLRFAETTDLRSQGFWGYAFISCLSMRQAFQLLVRFSSLRHSAQLAVWEEAEWAVFEWSCDPSTPASLETVAGDGFLACFCYNRRRWLQGANADMQAFLTYPEEPHHQALRALVGGPVTFNAPKNQVRIPRCELDLPSRGRDSQLLNLCVMQLERQLSQWTVGRDTQDLTARVQKLMRAQLTEGTSLDHVAKALRLSVRTLRRRLEATGVSFLELLERVRHEAAIEYLTHSGDAIAEIAQRVGYGDTSNFRRAFRRWTGQSPGAFRARVQASRERQREVAERAPKITSSGDAA
jgi:AraC-like DNA-binding protein